MPTVALPLGNPSTLHWAAAPPGTEAENCCFSEVVSAANDGLTTTALELVTVTPAVAALLPPASLQVSVKLVFAVSIPVEALPLVGSDPLQPPEAVHEVAFVELHVRTDAVPVPMIVGLAVSDTVGGAVTVTVTVDLAGVVPLAPLHVSEKLVVALSAPLETLPLVALVPLQPPEAVHEVAFVELHVRTDALPVPMVVGLAVSDAVGAGAAVTVTVAVELAGVVPLAPVHVNEKLVVALSAPLETLPLVALAPLQPPEPVHDVALVVLQVSIALPPVVTLAGAAASVAVGAAGVVVSDDGLPPEPPQPQSASAAASAAARS